LLPTKVHGTGLDRSLQARHPWRYASHPDFQSLSIKPNTMNSPGQWMCFEKAFENCISTVLLN
jgi:hypothetical protein